MKTIHTGVVQDQTGQLVQTTQLTTSATVAVTGVQTKMAKTKLSRIYPKTQKNERLLELYFKKNVKESESSR